MKTEHNVHFENSENLKEEVELVVTSPPYPMIEMWDELFADLGVHIDEREPRKTFEYMHQELSDVWKALSEKVVPGGYVCINIGNTTRKFGDDFRLFDNTSRISLSMRRLGFIQLPYIIWKKPTNSPNSFMGSGMSPPNQYITNEHEYILIFRQRGRLRNPDRRHESSYFFEERNEWFSETWDIPGEEQDGTAQFPFEVPFRLINMFSVYGDTVLDPFWGTGTTTQAAIASGRHSVGYELDSSLAKEFLKSVSLVEYERYQKQRLIKHNKEVDNSFRCASDVGHVKTEGQEEMKVYVPTEKEFKSHIGEMELEIEHEEITFESGGGLLNTERYE